MQALARSGQGGTLLYAEDILLDPNGKRIPLQESVIEDIWHDIAMVIVSMNAMAIANAIEAHRHCGCYRY